MRITFVAALLSSFSLAALAAPSDGKITVIQVDSQLKGSSSGANLKVTFTIKNKGNQAYNILNTPTSLLSTTLDTDKFNPVNRDTKQEPIFTGIQLKWDAEGSARDKNFFVLRPGEEVKVDHDITKRYDFSRSGSGPYTLSPSEFVEIVDSTGSIQLARLEPAPKGELRVGGRFLQMVAKAEDKVKQVAVKTGGNYNATAIRITNCPGREQVITNAALAANLLLQRAQDHLQQTHSQSLWNQAPTRTWFGIFTQSRSEKITQNMANIWSPFENVYKYDCLCQTQDRARTYAFVNRQIDDSLINLCPRFFTAPPTGYDSKAGTLIHEASHLKIKTKDVKYGTFACQALAFWVPDWMVNNADTYQYFSEAPWPGALELSQPAGRLVGYLSNWVSTLMRAVPSW